LLLERSVRVQLDPKQGEIPDYQARVEALTAGLPPPEQKLQDLINQRREAFRTSPGDPTKGTQVFKTNCAGCHQIAGQGAKVGPQLDGIGSRGVDRILEDLLDPNRNVDQAFRAITLALANGQVITGLLLREEGDVLVVADSDGKEQRFQSSQIDERKISNLSPMPAGFSEKIRDVDFADLVAYLLSQKSK
jgi:putative heme-binding domain-containing protein